MSKKILENLFLKKTLTKDESRKLIIDMSNGNINDYKIIAIISIYNMRNPTINEIVGFYQAMRELSINIDLEEKNAIDIVGTGGDKNTFNISTIACFIVAGAGGKVIKHGNYGSSSITGASNILKGLGFKFTNKKKNLKNQLNKTGICYLHAPIFHHFLKKISIYRKNLEVKTIFNLLGPMLNPCNPRNILLGVNNLNVARIYHYIYQYKKNNYTIIHSVDGYDEITLTSNVKCYTNKGENFFSVKELNKNNVNVNIKDLKGGNSIQENIKIFLDILSGKGTTAQNEIVLTNATFALNLINNNDFKYNYNKARHSLESGKAKNVLKKLLNL
ncbi:anthranilate phosphoribosyltransferase [Blattabacterium cuenoti]|uniref:anthranilate phosphoribosyltransferase n=1 Tax=Blattabacterium cuenoti TaxID=1653831 RepID=UPI00163BF865|nr:anthranilate phosphoribosyltransferase [Blattabacterium cuenoti]